MTGMRRQSGGFTVVELMIAVGIVGIVAAMALPSWRQFQTDQRLRDVARASANMMQTARSQAIATGNNHIVYLSGATGEDICTNPLVDAQGNPVPMLVLDDGPPGPGANCCIDGGERVLTEPVFTRPGMMDNVNWGATFAAGPAPTDGGGGNYVTGSTFTDANGNQARWVMFRPDGIPVDCLPSPSEPAGCLSDEIMVESVIQGYQNRLYIIGPAACLTTAQASPVWAYGLRASCRGLW